MISVIEKHPPPPKPWMAKPNISPYFRLAIYRNHLGSRTSSSDEHVHAHRSTRQSRAHRKSQNEYDENGLLAESVD